VSLPGSRRPSATSGSTPHSRAPSSTTPNDAAAAAAPPASSPSLPSTADTTPRDLSTLVGLTVRLTLLGTPERTVEGAVFAVDTRTGFVALECAPTTTASTSTAAFAPGAGKKGAGGGAGAGQKADYRLVRLAQIKAVLPLFDSPPPTTRPAVQPKAVSVAAVRQIEAAAVRAEEQRMARIGPPGVSALGQETFDALAKTCVCPNIARTPHDTSHRLPVRWQGMTIVVLDDCQIAPPYADATGPPGPRLERVRKVLEGERQRLLKAKPGLAVA
jgi:hypothetical protein